MVQATERTTITIGSSVMDREITKVEVISQQVLDGEGEITVKVHLSRKPNEIMHPCEEMIIGIDAPQDKPYEITGIEVVEDQIIFTNRFAEIPIIIHYNNDLLDELSQFGG